MQAARYPAVAADSGHAADEVIRTAPAAVIVDLMLPDDWGWNSRTVARTNWWMGMKDVPVVVLSGRSEDEDLTRRRGVGRRAVSGETGGPGRGGRAYPRPADGAPAADVPLSAFRVAGRIAGGRAAAGRDRTARGRCWTSASYMGLQRSTTASATRRATRPSADAGGGHRRRPRRPRRHPPRLGAVFAQVLDPDMLDPEARLAFQGFRRFQTGWTRPRRNQGGRRGRSSPKQSNWTWPPWGWISPPTAGT